MPRKKKTEKPEKQKKEGKISFYQAVGRRREATARVRFYVGGNGEITVNDKPIEQYFPAEVAKTFYTQPFKLTESLGRFKVVVKVEGGGSSGQLGAVIHGIARTLEKIDKEKNRPILKKAGLLTRDPRAKERRKAGLAGKARAKKQSPKR